MKTMRSLLALFTLFNVSLALSTTGTSVENRITQRVAFKDIDPSQFRHPLDRDLTKLINTLPLGNIAEESLRRVFPVIEQGVRLDLLSSSVRVSPKQLPELHTLMSEACEILDLGVGDDERPMPELYVQSSSQSNAYTLALRGRETPPIVVVTSALLDKCSEKEIQTIIGHELGHLKCEHSLYLTLGGLATFPIRNLPFVGTSVDSTLQQWRLAAEYTCDRAAMLVAQDADVVAGAMLKLFAGTSKYDMDTEAFIAQCVEYDKLLKSANPLVRASIQSQQRTHPLPVRRVAELKKWAKSEDYKNILESGIGLENKDTPLVPVSQ